MKINDARHLSHPFAIGIIKLLRIMKLTAIILLIGFLQAHAEGFGQPSVTLSIKNAALPIIFSEISKKTDFRFVYSDDLLPANKKFSVEVTAQPLNIVLDDLFKGSGLS
ncbi:MAG: STN domain-containing protein, partial [Gloeobacteraceae cyanobacterium ES-bin-316]|nr:STN domain-containing protein [Ferruginibacter sp.]